MASGVSGAAANGAAIEVWITDPSAATTADRERWLAEWLAPDERARVSDARSVSRRGEIVVGRALLRSALAAELGGGASPASFHFVTDPGGRPALAREGQPAAAAALDFSVAHTRGLAVCAVARGGRVGVDAEYRARRTDPLAIARRFFSAGDAHAVEAADPSARAERFLERWTLREAYTKVLGTPLLELDRESVTFATDAPAGPRRVGAAADAGEAWCFWLLRPTPEHVVALAWRATAVAPAHPRLTLRRWPTPESPHRPPITRRGASPACDRGGGRRDNLA